jgi:uncharacterized membrane protein YphA (DoxX/SURF4 family)
MKPISFHILRVGLAITFLWIGILILQSPEGWGSYIQPWVEKFLPFSIKETMISTAIFDLLVGFLLLIDSYVWIAALLGAVHLIIVLVVSGITEVTVRDIAILAGSVALFFESFPPKFLGIFKNKDTSSMTPIQ